MLLFICLFIFVYNINSQNINVSKESNKFTHAVNYLVNICQQYKDKCYFYSIGKSVLGNDLLVISISNANPDIHIPLRPEVKYVGCIHGNEFVSQDVLVRFIEYLLTQDTDSNVKYLLQNMRVHILPIMNPDGFIESVINDYPSIKGRLNYNGFDLNRNFPDLNKNISVEVQPETYAVMEWLKNNDFILSANFNGGSLVASYPFDNYLNSDLDLAKTSLTKDNDVFVNLAKTYSFNHPRMSNYSCTDYDEFEDGITNGAKWYPIIGGMQDVNYWKYGCMEITLEVSCEKYPDNSSLLDVWTENKLSMLEYLKKANTGVKGIVKFSDGVPAENMTIMINSREPYFKTNKNGEYYRILLPGSYKLSVAIECLPIYQTVFEIRKESKLTILNITLSGNFSTPLLNKFPLFCSKSMPIEMKNASININLPNSSINPKFKNILLIFIFLIVF